MKKTDISQFTSWDWFIICAGLAKQLKEANEYVKMFKDDKDEEIKHLCLSWQIETREILEVAMSHHDRLLKDYDRATDCEPIRNYEEIAEALDEYEETIDF